MRLYSILFFLTLASFGEGFLLVDSIWDPQAVFLFWLARYVPKGSWVASGRHENPSSGNLEAKLKWMFLFSLGRCP